MPDVRHIYAKVSDMAKEKMCPYTQPDHALPHWKFVFTCCAKCTCVNLTDQEKDDQYSETSTLICFNIYHLIARC